MLRELLANQDLQPFQKSCSNIGYLHRRTNISKSEKKVGRILWNFEFYHSVSTHLTHCDPKIIEFRLISPLFSISNSLGQFWTNIWHATVPSILPISRPNVIVAQRRNRVTYVPNSGRIRYKVIGLTLCQKRPNVLCRNNWPKLINPWKVTENHINFNIFCHDFLFWTEMHI